MSPKEQQQVGAGMAYLERQCANLAHEGANAAMLAESLAMQLKEAKEEIVALKEKLPKETSNVVPITDPA